MKYQAKGHCLTQSRFNPSLYYEADGIATLRADIPSAAPGTFINFRPFMVLGVSAHCPCLLPVGPRSEGIRQGEA